MVKRVSGVLKNYSAFVMASAAALTLSGCVLGPDFLRPGPPNVTGYTATPLPPETVSAATIAGDAQRFLQGTDVPGRWWTQFEFERQHVAQ